MKRSIVLACLASFLLGGCFIATRPVGRGGCPPDRYWDGHKCKKDKREQREEREERKEEKREEKRERKREKERDRDD